MALPISDQNVQYRPVINPLLIGINIIIFITSLVLPQLFGAKSFDEVILRYGFIPFLAVYGVELYRFITHMFLHGGLDHIFGNMLFLYIFGDNVEAAMGPIRYLIFYIVAGIIASLFHLLSIMIMPPYALLNYRAFTGVDPWLVPAIGASGAISAVLGAYLILYPRSTVRALVLWFPFPFVMSVPAAFFIAFWFLYQLFMGVVSLTGGLPTGVAFWAHIGGFLAGMALTPIFADRRRIRMYRMMYEVWGFYW